MKTTFYKSCSLLTLGVAGLVGCGSETTEVTEVTEYAGMQLVEADKSMPECTSDNEGDMVYAVDSSAGYFCADGEWVSLKSKNEGKTTQAEDGESCMVKALDDNTGFKILCGGDSVGVLHNGLNGTDGTDGKDGKDGTDGKDSHGTDGNPGESCTIAALSDSGSYKIVCGGDSLGVVHNGENGKDGKNAVDFDFFIDPRDKKIYRITTIGTQTWIAQNLYYKSKGAFCHDSMAACDYAGFLYTWSDAQMACPKGWHLPSSEEFNTLFDAVGGIKVAAYKLKSKAGWENLYDWLDNTANENPNGDDAYGFSVISAGFWTVECAKPWFYSDGECNTNTSMFATDMNYARFWVSDSPDSNDSLTVYHFESNRDNVGDYYKAYIGDAMSVRCLKDAE